VSFAPQRRPPIDPATVRRVLLIRPRYLGDICLTLPALEAVRDACPHAEIGYVVEEESAPLLEGDPRIARLFVVRRQPGASGTLKLVGALRRFAPDLAIDFFCNPRTSTWTWASGARTRVGYPNKGWRSALYTHHARPRTLSAVRFHLASLAALGWPATERVPALHIPHDRRTEALQALAALAHPAGAALAGVRLVGFHPGARWPTRRWAPDRFAALARRMLDERPDTIALITGTRGEQPLVDQIVAALPHDRALAVVGWPLARFVALQSACAAFVCGDTGPVHPAVAAGAPTLGLISRNRPAMFFPYPESHGHRAHYARVECSPCNRDECADLRCLHRLTVDGGWAILSGMLGAPGARAVSLPTGTDASASPHAPPASVPPAATSV
jgi:ADP-heptose:LPS heptosyltransferase